jgi:hypothetical protein
VGGKLTLLDGSWRAAGLVVVAGLALSLTACDSGKTRASTGAAEDSGQEMEDRFPGAAEPTEAELVAALLPAEVSFNDHIQPVLSEYCYHCHGPDSGTREPKSEPLRLDRPEDAFAPREDGRPVIIKGKPAESLLVELIRSKDPDVVMPPPKSHKTMSEREIALIERWIEQGAEYQPHWAFAPVQRPEPPAAGDAWAANPIDRFIAEKLDAAGLEASPPEDVRRFHRRLTLDLTGLPPTPEETSAFVKASAADPRAATAAEADRLLASMASAEHFARHWLDAARYADTHGIHIDNYRAIWPYRDWVIRAFHANMPWDQFTLEQIAGDMLPDRTLDQQVATGFSRCLATTGEGGAIADEYNEIYAKDRVETVSAIWLGLTTGCAACHDHKFDPVSAKEFYELTAFFRNTPMSALDGNKADHPPNVFVPLVEDRGRWAAIPSELASVEKELAGRDKTARPDFEQWLAKAAVEAAPTADANLAIHLPLADAAGPLTGRVDGQPREWPAELERIDGPLGKAPVISGTAVDLGDIGSFSRKESVTFGGFIRIEGTPTGAVIARMNGAEAFRGWDLYLQAGQVASHVIDNWSESASKVVADEVLAPGVWHHVMVTFDGSKPGNQALAIHLNGKLAKSQTSPNTVGDQIETQVPLRLGARHGDDSKLNGRVAMQDFRFYRRLLNEGEISRLATDSVIRHALALAPEQRTKEQVDQLYQHFVSHVDETARGLRKRIGELKGEQEAIRARGSVSLVMEEKKEEPYAHVLNRGVYSDKGEKVGPGTPAVLPPMPADAPKNRLGLARWLSDPANPLPARVTMNRAWYYIFGTGIVESNDDFGIMGARPSHPKLLDWLAAEFVASGWDHRHMIRLMVTSETYRQSGKVSPEKLEKDPANRLLSRGPRIRLDAEPIRDLALAASGLLSPKVGGPPVKPYQPEGIWEAVAMKESNTRHYKQDSGEALYRRSLYTLWKRTAAPATMEIFNAPTREVFCVRRDRTNTPLQALALMNDPQFIEASRELAARAMAHSSDPAERINFISLRLAGRTFEDAERTIVRETLDDLLENFRKQPEDAAKLVATGEKPAPADVDVPELAAWTMIASQILNLDETITR